MEETQENIIYTIGHSTHPIDEFIEILNHFGIKILVDIRRFPGSRKYPQFNKDSLELSLKQAGIGYRHIEQLGGRRKSHSDSQNKSWRNESFRAYADYMEEDAFKDGIKELESYAYTQPTAFMCSEALWWRCHRSMVADYLKVKGWEVIHIMSGDKTEIHPYTSPARIINGELSYKIE